MLRKPGNAVIINLDAPVEGGGAGFVWRGFAGHKKHALSIGAIKLARLSGCAIIGCVCYVRKDGVTVIEWGDVIRLSEDGTKSEDLSAMNELVDKIELAIRERPEQYVLDIGDERRWDARRGEWADL
jgi:lauroyl/myristoyl acyltransferase